MEIWIVRDWSEKSDLYLAHTLTSFSIYSTLSAPVYLLFLPHLSSGQIRQFRTIVAVLCRFECPRELDSPLRPLRKARCCFSPQRLKCTRGPWLHENINSDCTGTTFWFLQSNANLWTVVDFSVVCIGSAFIHDKGSIQVFQENTHILLYCYTDSSGKTSLLTSTEFRLGCWCTLLIGLDFQERLSLDTQSDLYTCPLRGM